MLSLLLSQYPMEFASVMFCHLYCFLFIYKNVDELLLKHDSSTGVSRFSGIAIMQAPLLYICR